VTIINLPIQKLMRSSY